MRFIVQNETVHQGGAILTQLAIFDSKTGLKVEVQPLRSDYHSWHSLCGFLNDLVEGKT